MCLFGFLYFIYEVPKKKYRLNAMLLILISLLAHLTLTCSLKGRAKVKTPKTYYENLFYFT